MVAARGESVSEKGTGDDMEKTGEMYRRYVDGLSQSTPSTCTSECLMISLDTSSDDKDSNEHHLRTDFRITRSSTNPPQREASIPVSQ